MCRRLARTVLGCICLSLCFISDCTYARHTSEEFAIGSMIQIRAAEEAYKSSRARYGTLTELTDASLSVPAPVQYGYKFALQATTTTYIAVGTPIAFKENSLSLYLDQSQVIRGMFKNGRDANSNDPPLKGSGINK